MSGISLAGLVVMAGAILAGVALLALFVGLIYIAFGGNKKRGDGK